MAVTNGVMPVESDNMFAGKLLTYESGAPDSFKTFDAFYEAVKAQVKYAIDECHANLVICEKLLAEQFNLPTFTVLLDGALERAKDDIAADLWKWFSDCTVRLKMYRGHYCDAAIQMVQSNVGYGAMTGATPNGRLAGMPISDTMSASQQADTNGPTAAARS